MSGSTLLTARTRAVRLSLALLMVTALSAACNTSSNTHVVPTAPSPVQSSPASSGGRSWHLDVRVGPGTTGSPGSAGDYSNGQTVTYAFSATDGASDVFVGLDGGLRPPSGSFTMNADHKLLTFISNLPGARASDFTGQTWDGTTVRLSALRGKVVLFNVVDAGCFASAIEAPALQQIYVTYHPKGLEVITVLSLTVGSTHPTASELRGWVNTWGLTYPVINDPDDAYKIYYRELLNCSSGECSGWPNNYIIDGSGVIIYRSSGFNGPELSAKLAALFP